MRKTKLMVTHPEVASEKLADFVSGRGPIRMGLRIAILQGVMVHRYRDGSLAIFHGPRKLADYDKHGKLMEVTTKKAA